MSDLPSMTIDPGSGKFSRQARALLLVLCGALFLTAVNVSMIGVALPVIGRDLELSTSSLQWLLSAYVLGFGGFLLLGGRAADLFGRRRVFLAALVVSVLGSAACALAADGTVLIAARFVTGVSAAFIAPASLSLITTGFAEGPARNRALTIYGATGATGFALGLVVGGLLATAGWRFVFFTPVVVGAVMLAFGSAVLPRSEPTPVRVRCLDLSGAATITAAMMLLVFTLVELPSAGAASLRTLGSFVVVAALAGLFVVIEGRSRAPLMRFGIFRSGQLLRSSAGAVGLEGAWVGCLFILTLYLQDLREWSALETGLAVFPTGFVVALLAPRISAPLVGRFGLRPVITAGLTSGALAYLLLLRIEIDSSYVTVLLPAMLLVGMAFALAFGPLNIAATNGVSDGEQGLAGGVINTAFQLGAAFVVAAVTAVNEGANGSVGTATPAALLDGFHAALLVPLAFALLGAVIWAMPTPTRTPTPVPTAAPAPASA